MELGEIAARVFDRIIIKEDDDKRGRESGSAADFILKGVMQANANVPTEIILNETEALETALTQVEPGGLVVIFPESVSRAITHIQRHNPVG
jgi:cyanophycin synthetase